MRRLVCAALLTCIACDTSAPVQPAPDAGVTPPEAIYDPIIPCGPGSATATCGASPADLQTDPANCGSCGNICPAGSTCGLGLCWAAGESMRCTAAGVRGTWTELGPPLTGRIDAVLPDTTDPNTVLVGAPGGGLWKTDSGGSAWKRVGATLADQTVLHLARDRLDSSRLYALTATEFYVSKDAGDTWTAATGSGGHPRLRAAATNADPFAFALLLPPGGGEIVLWSFRSSGLYYSIDGAETVEQIDSVRLPGLDDIVSIAADDTTGLVYFSTASGTAFMQSAPVFRSTLPWTGAGPPAALEWSAAGRGLPGYPQSVLLAWAREPDRLIAMSTESSTTTYTSTDGGRSWVQGAGLNSWTGRPLLVPEPGHLFLGAVAAYESLDSGATWNIMLAPPGTTYFHPDVRALALQDTGSAKYLWQGMDGTFDGSSYADLVRWSYRSGARVSDPVVVPTAGPAGVRTWQTYFALLAGESTVHVGSQDNGRLCTNDGGASWHSSFGGNGCGDEIALAIAPTNTSRAYALTCDASSILRSDNADAPCADVTFRPLTDANYAWSPSPFHWSKHLIAVDPRNADHLAIARGVGVTVSSDGGASATIRALPSNARSVSVLYDDGGVLWVGTTGGIFRSTDDGATFEVVQPDLAAVYALASSPAAGGGQGTIFAGTSDGLFLRRPGGRFHRVLGGGGHIVSEVVVDPSCPSRIYAGFGYSFRSVHRGGVSISTDGGATWSSLSAGAELHNVPITGIQIAPGTQGRLYVSTFGRGAWTFDAEQPASCP